MQRAIQYLDSRAPNAPIQVQARHTYGRFISRLVEAVSEDYLEDNIPVDMQRSAKNQ